MTARALRIEALTLGDLASIRSFVREAAAAFGADAVAADDLAIAVDEAVTNVVRHGYRGTPAPIDVEVVGEGGTVAVRLLDEAPVFDLTAVAASPDLSLDIGQRPFGGMGIHLMRTSTDRIVHRARGRTGNDLTFFKDLSRTDGRIRE